MTIDDTSLPTTDMFSAGCIIESILTAPAAASVPATAAFSGTWRDGTPCPINKVIWICWFQGWENAPWLVRKCLSSWQQHNPEWDIRTLDRNSVQRYIELPDLAGKTITAASMSDIIRILLLHEYGGVWVDATLLCHQPLDTWLPDAMCEGFFAFNSPGWDRPLSSWFIAAEEGHSLIAQWHAAVLQYWHERSNTEYYFWFHYLFADLCKSNVAFRKTWQRVPKISARGPHYLQSVGLLEECEAVIDQALCELPPVSKLTYRFNQSKLSEKTLVSRLLSDLPEPKLPSVGEYAAPNPTLQPLASLRVSTKNLGDHIQIIASKRLLERNTTVAPSILIDRDNEIASVPFLPADSDRWSIILNGWFKTNCAEWPPSQLLNPIFIGFHIRLFQCPELLSETALDYYRQHSPIGCRDRYTLDLLQARGIECFYSGCLSLSFPRRPFAPQPPQEVFVVSRNKQILSILPPELDNATFISHYVESRDFSQNMQTANNLLDIYRTRARLIVTTLLHCALPAMAMGIPVVMFYPKNNEAGHVSDRERFSSLGKLIPIHRFEDVNQVNWNPLPIKLSAEKIHLLDCFHQLYDRWQLPRQDRMPVFAPSNTLRPIPQARSKPLLSTEKKS